jgi:predicted GH43/DUF377 family glycosyl hydrolase
MRTVTGGDVTRILSCLQTSHVTTDESRYNLTADSRVRIYHQKGERFAPVCVKQHDRLGGGCVIVSGKKTRLIVIHGNLNTQRYINGVFNVEAIPFMQRNGFVVFQ